MAEFDSCSAEFAVGRKTIGEGNGAYADQVPGGGFHATNEVAKVAAADFGREPAAEPAIAAPPSIAATTAFVFINSPTRARANSSRTSHTQFETTIPSLQPSRES